MGSDGVPVDFGIWHIFGWIGVSEMISLSAELYVSLLPFCIRSLLLRIQIPFEEYFFVNIHVDMKDLYISLILCNTFVSDRVPTTLGVDVGDT